jgi:ABC-type lipoprotein release transport system permease subunit
MAYFSGEVISNRVYAIRASDPVILASATLLIGAITLVATLIPAVRASRLNPANVLQWG